MCVCGGGGGGERDYRIQTINKTQNILGGVKWTV